MGPKGVDGMAKSVDRDQTAPHCLPRPISPNTLDHYGNVGAIIYNHINVLTLLLYQQGLCGYVFEVVLMVLEF